MHQSDTGKPRSAVVSWIVYDIGSTVFFTGVVGLLFPLWVTRELGGDDATVGYTLAASMAVSVFLAPVIGALSDQARRRVPMLAAGTMICALTTFFLGGDNLNLALPLFGLGLVAIYGSEVLYSSLLAEVSTSDNSGTIAGIGVGVGYLGAIIALAIGLLILDSGEYELGFRSIALVIVLAAIPLFAFFRERTRRADQLTVSELARGTWRQLQESFGEIPRYPGLLLFLVARFWYSLSLYTASTFAVLYAVDTVGFTQREVILLLTASILVAIPSGLAWGVIVDRVGPARAMRWLLAMWTAILLFSVAIPWLDLPPELWWVLGVVSGILLPGIWTTDRPFLLRLTSSRYLGEVFGLRSMTGRLSAMVGPFVWGLISVTLGFGQPAAVLSLAVSAAIAFVLVRGIDDRIREQSEDVQDRQLPRTDV